MQNTTILHIIERLFFSSEGHLTETPVAEGPDLIPTSNNLSNSSLHPTTQIEESIPLNDSNGPTSDDNQPALLGINSPTTLKTKIYDRSRISKIHVRLLNNLYV